MILGCAPQHGRAADVNVLDRFLEGDVRPRHSRFKGIEVYHHEVNRLDALRADGSLVVCVAAEVQQSAVDFGMKSLYPAVQHFRKASVSAKVGNGKAGLPQCSGGATRGNQFHTCGRQHSGQRHETRLVGNRKQRALHLLHNRALPSSRRVCQVNRQKCSLCVTHPRLVG